MGLLIVALTERTEQLGVGEGSAGFVLTALEIGCVVTNIALIRLQNRWWIVLASMALYGVVLTSWSLAGTFPVLLALALLAGLALGPEFPALLAARQRYSPAGLLSQVGATGASMKTGAYALGAALVGPLRTVLSPAGVLAVVGVMQVVSALAGWAVSRSAPEPGAVATADRRRSA